MGLRPPEPNIPGESNANLIYVPVIVFSILCPAIVSIRVWTRLQNQGKLGADDWLIIAALVWLPRMQQLNKKKKNEKKPKKTLTDISTQVIALASSGIMIA